MINKITQGDTIEKMKLIEAGSVDMILADLPYGTTQNKWDTIVPFDELWEQYNRIVKDSGAIVLTASQPFTTKLINSNFEQFRYCWYWYKNYASGFQYAKYQPARAIEEVLVFYKAMPTYNKQPTQSRIKDRERVVGKTNGKRNDNGVNGHKLPRDDKDNVFKENVTPRNVLEINSVPRATGTLHPTQKPVELFEYLVKTYTNENELVLDNVIGSGTTAVACLNTNRSFIGIEKEQKYVDIANERIANSQIKLFI